MEPLNTQEETPITTHTCEMFLAQNEEFNEKLKEIIEGVWMGIRFTLIHYAHWWNISISETNEIKQILNQIIELANWYDICENTLNKLIVTKINLLGALYSEK